MDFADEHYVKLFTRDTVTWNRWPWQAQAVLGPLMRKLNKAGVADVDPRFGVAESIAALLGNKWPVEVLQPALDAWLADGTFELSGSRLVMPKFLEAQESRKTKQVIAHDYRQKQRDVARAKSAGLLERPVTIRDQAGQVVTSRDPPAQPDPSPAQPDPEKTAGPKPKKARTEKPPDPRHAPLVGELTKTFERETGAKYPFGPIDAAAVTALLAKGIEPTIVAAWTKALRSSSYPVVRTLAELVKHLAHFVGTAPPAGTTRREEPAAPRPEGRVRL